MRPLEGITVVTLEHAIAAPFCTRQLADLGARVFTRLSFRDEDDLIERVDDHRRRRRSDGERDGRDEET